MKMIVIGTSLAGKTTLIRLLRKETNLPILEIDEELVRLNGGEFPTDPKLKHKVVAPKVIKEILDRESIVFFTNTNYFTIGDLKQAKEKGFLIIQLEINLEELIRRNISRMEDEGYDDMSEWLEGMLKYQQDVKQEGLVDKTIDAIIPTNEVAKQLLEFINY